MKILLLSLLLCLFVPSRSIDPALVYSTEGRSYTARVLCDLVLQCTNKATNIFWSYSGVASPIEESPNIFTNLTVLGTDGAFNVFQSTLKLTSFREVSAKYSCNIEGPESVILPYSIDLNQDIISVFPPSTVDIADYEVGEKVPIEIEVQTCLPDYDISVYKGKDRVFYALVRNARESSVKVLYHLTVSNSSVGQYAARVTADAASTRLTYFNVTGV